MGQLHKRHLLNVKQILKFEIWFFVTLQNDIVELSLVIEISFKTSTTAGCRRL
jgi:hypothetical protein